MENSTLYDVRNTIIAKEYDSLLVQGVIDEDDHKWLNNSLHREVNEKHYLDRV